MLIAAARKIALGLLLIQAIVVAASVQAGESCAMSATKRRTLLALPFQSFDQQQGNGWRPLYANKCYAEAALLLEDYVKQHPEAAREQYMLPFHTGQLFALAGEHEKAVRWMEKGYSADNSGPINWNAFVDANIAFLKHDHEALLKQRGRIDKEPVLVEAPGTPSWAVGKKMNLDVVDGFLACFDKPYDVAYGDRCRAGRTAN